MFRLLLLNDLTFKSECGISKLKKENKWQTLLFEICGMTYKGWMYERSHNCSTGLYSVWPAIYTMHLESESLHITIWKIVNIKGSWATVVGLGALIFLWVKERKSEKRHLNKHEKVEAWWQKKWNLIKKICNNLDHLIWDKSFDNVLFSIYSFHNLKDSFPLMLNNHCLCFKRILLFKARHGNGTGMGGAGAPG